MANIATMFAPSPFGGGPEEDVVQFLAQLNASMALNNIGDGNQVNFIGLKLKDAALSWFEQLDPNAERANGPALLQALADRYNNEDNHLTNRSTFEKRKFNQATEDIQAYKTALQKLAAVSFDAAQRPAKVREQFIQGLPGRLKRKALSQPAAHTVHQLADHLRHIIAIDKYCPTGDAIAPFNSLESEVTLDKVMNAIHRTQEEVIKTKDDNLKRFDKVESTVSNMANAGWKGKAVFAKNQNQRPFRQRNNPNYGPNFNPAIHGTPIQTWFTQPPVAPQQYAQPAYAAPQPVQQYVPQQPQFQVPQQSPPQRYQYQNTNFTPGPRNQNQRFYRQPYRPRMPPGNVCCHGCGQYGHYIRDCNARVSPNRNQPIPYEQRPAVQQQQKN